jgi:hypothetical protein
VAAGGLASAGEDSGGGIDFIDDFTEPVPDDAEELTDAETDAIITDLMGLATLLPVASGDDSSSLTGPCGGFAYSYDGDGTLIDFAYDLGDGAPPQDGMDGGQAFTSGNPFVVDTSGKVTYLGFAPLSGDGPVGHTYSLSVGGVEVASGGDPNTNAKNRNAGTIFMDDELPFPITAKFSASGWMKSNIPECRGEGHVAINGNGLLDPAGLAGMGLTLVGLLGLLFNAPPARTWKG